MPETPRPDPSRARTWATLLAYWTEFAQRAVALPAEGEGGRWKASVAPIIGLQAITHALAETETLPPDERALGLDRAELLIRRHAKELHGAWRGEPMPEAIDELLQDAAHALVGAQSLGLEWLVRAEALEADHPAELVAALLASGFTGDLDLPAPGVPLFAGCVAAHLRPGRRAAIDPDHAALVGAFLGQPERLVAAPRGVRVRRLAYRQFDFAQGGPVRDVLAPEDQLPAGQPLLVRAIEGGQAQPVPLPPRRSAPIQPLPVEELTD